MTAASGLLRRCLNTQSNISGRCVLRPWGAILRGRTRLNHGHRPIHTSLRLAEALRPSAHDDAPIIDTHPLHSETGPRSRLQRSLVTTALVLVCTGVGFTVAAAPAVETVSELMNPPEDADTLRLFRPETPQAERVNNYILQHPLALSLRSKPSIYTEARPHMKIPVTMRPHNFTGGTLLGPDKIEVPAVTFAKTKCELPTLTSIVYLGPLLCGDPGTIHDGLLATILDEGLARACFPALPNKVGVTASLEIRDLKPCPAGSYVVMRAETVKVEGRKAWVKGHIELLGDDDHDKADSGRVLVEAEALFIEPRGAQHMARMYSPS